MGRWFGAWLLAAAGSLAAVAPALSQSRSTSGDVTGVVLDESNAVLPGTTVTVTNDDTGLARTVTTEAGGRYLVPALPPGLYDIRAELSGFAPRVLEGVRLALGATVDLQVVLKVAGAQAQVTVTATGAVVDTLNTAIAGVVSQQQIENLPINGRSFISFSLITPGVYTDRTPQQGASGTSGLSFAGQRARSNNITVDGLDNNDLTVGAVRATFSQEAVREFQVLTSSYSAEFGKASGGVVNIVTKSGTNRVRGTAFGFFRDRSLNSRGHFEKFDAFGREVALEKAPFNQNQFGGTVGGPVRKDRAFYFLSFERLDITASNFVTIDDRTLIPNPFSAVPFGTPKQILAAKGFAVDTGHVPYDLASNQFLGKADLQLTPGNALTVRFNAAGDLNENIEPFGGIVAKSRAARLDSRDIMAAASETAILSNRLLNELRFQVAHRNQTVQSLDPRCDGECDRFDEGGPTVEIPGIASVGRQRFTPQPRRNTRYQIIDTVSYYVGAHQIKSGFDFSDVNNPEQSLPLHFGGRFIFAPVPVALLAPGTPGTLSAIQAFALDVPGAWVQGYGDPAAPYTYRDLSLFVQDEWRITPRLTAKLGLRYQYQFWPSISYTIAGRSGSYEFPRDGNNVAPRLAFAWDPDGDKTTLVHGAYGVFFDNLISGVAGVTDVLDGEASVRTFVARLSATDVRPLLAWRAPGRRLPEAALGPYPSLEIAIDPGLVTPYAHHGSVGLDRELPGDLTLSANVLYVKGSRQMGTIDYNPVVPGLLPTGRLRPADRPGQPLSTSSVLQYTSFGETWYRGLIVSLARRLGGRYQFLSSYTLSKAEDNSTDFQSAFIPQENGLGRDPNQPSGLPIGFRPDDERGPALQDQRHRFVLSGVYLAPAGVRVASIVTAGSGRPYNILAGADLNQDGDGGAFPSDRPWRVPGNLSTRIGRNLGRLPAQATVDLRVARTFPIKGRAAVEGIFEVFNLFNRTNFELTDNGPNIFGSGAYPENPLPSFGRYTQAGAPRQIQLAARLTF